MLKNSISIITDPKMAIDASFSGVKVVYMQEGEIPETVLGCNCIPATILLPPFEAVAAEIDGNYQGSRELYIQHLMSKECDMYICAIMMASIKGIPILILMDKDANDMSFASVFYEYLANCFGIIVATPNNPFMYNSAFDGVNISKLYAYDLIGYEMFFIMYPMEQPLCDFVIPKLVMEMNPYVEDRSAIGYLTYFNNYKNSVKLNSNKLLIIPATFVGE